MTPSRTPRTLGAPRATLLAVGAACALTLSACAGSGPAAPPADRDFGTPVAGEITPGILDGVTLTYASAGGVFQDGQKTAIWDPFAAASGATVLQDAFDSGKLKAMVEGNNVQWDVVNTTQFDSAHNCGTLYEKLDYAAIDTSQLPEGTITDECMVPNIMYGLVVAYNTELFGDRPPTSAADFFDTERFPGKRGVSQSTYPEPQVLEFALLADGIPGDAMTAASPKQAVTRYLDLGDNLVGWSTGAQAQQQLESGEVAMSLVWSGRGYGAAAAGGPVAPMWDDWMVMLDSTAIPKGAKDVPAAHAAVNYFLGVDQQRESTELTSLGGVNVNAQPTVDPVLDAWLTADHVATGHVANVAFWVDNYELLSETWAAWVTGVE